jgi:HK97 family phage prohead protease
MSNSSIEFKAMPGQFNVDEAQGIVECFVAGIGNKDSVGDVLIAGAFSKSLTRRKPRVVWGHNWNDPIGKVLEIYEVPPGDRRLPQKMINAGIGGLYAKVQFNLNSEKGREAFANVAFFGQEQEWSIGYKTLDAIFDPNIQANVLKEVELYEVSPVLHGANQLTGTISVKSDELALAEEEKGWGMMNPHHMMGQMPMKPNVIVIREEDEDDDDKYESEKPIFSEGLAQPIDGSQRQRLEKEIMERTGSQVRLVEATENTAVFQRMMPNGTPMTFRIGYHTPDNYSTFMFGKPELVNGQNKPSQFGGKPSGSRVVVPSQMPMMPMQVKPGYDPNGMVVMPKSDLSGQLEELEDALMQELDEKVGRTINKRNLSKLKSILENLQDVIASAEKEDLETKGYLIPVELESAFHTKSILDPIFDYHRVESIVTEDGILITSGVTKDLVEAIDNAQKGLGRNLRGGLGKGPAAGRAAFARFDPNAWDGDGDGLVQEGTPFQRPAIPGVNDRATGGKVNARRAVEAYQGGAGFASTSNKPERTHEQITNILGDKWGRDLIDEADANYIRILNNIGSDEDITKLANRLDIPEDSVRDIIEDYEKARTGQQLSRKKPFSDENLKNRKPKGFASSSGKPELVSGRAEKVDDVIDQAARTIVGKGNASKITNRDGNIYSFHQDEYDKVLSSLNEIFAPLSKEKIKESPGKALSEVRKNLVEKLSDEDFIEQFESREQIDDFLGSVEDAIEEALTDRFSEIEKTGSKSELKEFEELSSDLESDFRDMAENIAKRAKDFWATRRKEQYSDPWWGRGEIELRPEDAKEQAKFALEDLIDIVERGLQGEAGGSEDFADWLDSLGKSVITSAMKERIRNGEFDTQDLQYELEMVLEHIQELDPSMQPEELTNKLRKALKKGGEKNTQLEEIADSWGDEDITGGDLINELRRVQKDSKYRPDRGRSEKERLRGFASSSRTDDAGDPDYDEAFGPRERTPGRGMQADPVGDEVADRLDRDSQNRAVRRGFASSGGKEKLEDDFKQVDMTLEEYGELQDSINNVIKKLEEGDFGAEDEIEKLKELTEKIDASIAANDMIPLEDDELGDYLGILESMRDGGVGLDDVSKEDKDNIDSLIDALKEAQKTGYSESGKLKEAGTRLSVAGRSTRSRTRDGKLTSEGTLTPAKKLSITLDEDGIALLLEEADFIADRTKDRPAAEALKEILRGAKGGKFEVTPEQFDSIVKLTEEAWENGLLTSDISGVLHQAAESADGKYDINDFIDPPKPKKGFASTNKINNGAPSDITESMQKEFIFWARRQRGLRVAQSIVEDFDKNNGQLKASQWKALRTMYGNMGPGSARGRGFGSRSGGPNISQPTGGGMRDTGGGPLPYVHTTSGWKKVGGAGGLNEASVMQDPKTGKKYYVKHTRAGEEFRGESEILTSKLYQLLGIGTIKYERGVHNGKLQRVSEWDPSIDSSVDHRRMSQDPQFRKSMQGTLIANAWLANWDGTGNMSNIVERDGEAVMADSGGGLLFRAQRYSGMKGQGGTDSFGPRVEEVYNLIHGKTRSGQSVQAGVSRAYYSDIEPEEIARQVKELGKVTDEDIRKLVAQTISDQQDGDRLAQILIARRDWIVDHWGTGKFVEKPSDTSRSDASGAKARPFASAGRTRGFASSSIDGPGDDEAAGRTARGARGMGEFVPGGNIAPGRSRETGQTRKKPGFETKFAGKTFEEMKPDNWDELTLDEKWQWAMTYGNPENIENVEERMSQVAYRKLLNDLMEEMDKDDLDAMTPAERRAELRRRSADQRELDSMGYMPETSLEKQKPAKKPSAPQEDDDEIVPVKVKKSKNAQEAQTERESRLDGFLEAIEKYRSKFDSDESEVDDHRDVWDKVSDAIQVGGYDFSLQSLDRAIEALDEYIGEFGEGELSKAERVNMSSAKAMRKQLAKARAGYANDEWIPGASKSKGSGFASVGSIPGREIEYTSGWAKGQEKRRKEAESMANAMRTVAKDIKKDIKKLQGSGNPGTRGFASTSSGGKTMITDEATFFRDVEKSLDKEIRRATKAGDKRAVKGLSKLAEIIRRDEASKTGSRRTNVGSVYFTVDEADEILDGLMFALDTQLEDGGEKRVEWYSRLIEMIAKAAKSTFIDKTTKEINSTTREATNSRGQKKKINIVPEA